MKQVHNTRQINDKREFIVMNKRIEAVSSLVEHLRAEAVQARNEFRVIVRARTIITSETEYIHDINVCLCVTTFAGSR